jgi:deazaflavin-dependent oxidoreductase (nitroreductase family)
MTAISQQASSGSVGGIKPTRSPRFGGALWRMVRLTNPVMKPLAGTRWNPIFALVEHRGRNSGRPYTTPVAARRIPDGFVISLSFGAQVDWHRNLVGARGGMIRWRGRSYPVGAPEPVDATTGIRPFNALQRLALRIGGIDGYILLRDADATLS